MAKPTSRLELIEYCKRNLGAPVLEINVAPSQLDDRVDEAIQMYQEYHSNATFEHLRKHLVTQNDLDNGYITIPENLIFISRILPHGAHANNMFSVEYQMHLNDIYSLRSPGSVLNYAMTKEYQGLLNMLFDNGCDQPIRFRRHLDRLYIDDIVTDFAVDDYIVIEGYSTIDPDEYTDVYNDAFLKRYLTALIKRQWGTNMKKFTGMQLPGGVEMNGQTIFDEAQADIEKIETEMQLRYEEPPAMAIG
ncbi:MAG: hypothetical protein D4S01_04515 [Dehalococcoidia bacterium]|nr:MAG: hypothetical protein D4S01_04515 [Dehalococcoidia bacterium]